ncbi:lipoprotein [Spirochaetia bacterium]|nr:lipoprotein [Spirochaetia bacterium]
MVKHLSMWFFLCLLNACTVVKLDDGAIIYRTRRTTAENTGQGSVFEKQFDPDEFVEDIWGTKAIPLFEENAVDIIKVKTALAANFDSACQQYGVRSNDKSSWVFTVYGSGTVKEINRESRNGYAVLAAGSPDDPVTLSIQIGPVYKGVALRDSLQFIQFNDYENQIVFNNISNALNRKVDRDIVGVSGIDGALGKEIAFTGAFMQRNAEESDIVLTAVKLSVKQ